MCGVWVEELRVGLSWIERGLWWEGGRRGLEWSRTE